MQRLVVLVLTLTTVAIASRGVVASDPPLPVDNPRVMTPGDSAPASPDAGQSFLAQRPDPAFWLDPTPPDDPSPRLIPRTRYSLSRRDESTPFSLLETAPEGGESVVELVTRTDAPDQQTFFTWPNGSQFSTPDDEVDINEPGLDMGDFPNSAYTLQRGRWQLEFSPVTLTAKNSDNPSSYSSPFLLRYGATDDVELRVIGSGLSGTLSPETQLGIGVLTFDTKIHLWDADLEHYTPAASFEAIIQTNLGTQAYRGGTQPSVNLNLDFPFTEKTNVEVTLSYSGDLVEVTYGTGARGPNHPLQVDENIYFFNFQWAIEHQLTDRLELFVHGFHNAPVHYSSGSSQVLGVGYFYKISNRIMTFGSANAGLTDAVYPFAGQLGIGYAF